MKIATTIVRLLLGLAFTVFGANILHSFLPQPPPPTEGPVAGFFGAMMVKTNGLNYMTVVGVLQLLGGLILLSGRFVAVGLCLLGPIIVNILLFHIFLAPGIAPGLVVAAMEVFLIYAYRDRFAPIFRA